MPQAHAGEAPWPKPAARRLMTLGKAVETLSPEVSWHRTSSRPLSATSLPTRPPAFRLHPTIIILNKRHRTVRVPSPRTNNARHNTRGSLRGGPRSNLPEHVRDGRRRGSAGEQDFLIRGVDLVVSGGRRVLPPQGLGASLGEARGKRGGAVSRCW